MTYEERVVGLRNRIIQGDCLEIMRELPDGIVQTVISSPPYW